MSNDVVAFKSWLDAYGQAWENPGLQTQLDGIFLISLDKQGRCKSLREWWHKVQK
jgi:hypothetical protein